LSEQPSTLPALLAQVVAARGAHPALVTRAVCLSYDELDERSARMARALLALGAGKGTRIALMAPDGVLWITTFLASARIGALLTAVSTLCTPAELAHILRHSDTQIFIGEREFLRHDYSKTLGSALPELARCPAGALHIPAAPYLRSIWLGSADGLDWAGSVDELTALADSPAAPDRALLRAIEQQVSPGDDAVIVYTSGSTSQPKAVVHTQRTIATHPPVLAKLFLLQPADRMMPLLPAFWLGGMAMALEVLSVGATLVYPDAPDIDVVLDCIETLEANRVNSWGDMLVKLRDAAIARGLDVDAIVGLGPFRDAGGALIPQPLQSNMLGMSETFAVHSGEPLDARLPEGKAGASGRTINGYERRIVNPDTGAEVAVGEVGELLLRGGGLMSGLYKVPREQVFTSDGFYPTGDLVRVDDEGYLYFIARRGDMIKTRAANVSRLEVEAALRTLPGVATAVVTGLADAELGQRVVAAVVLATGSNLSEDALKAALRNTLSSYKVPRNIIFVADADIPRTSTGKVRLFALADMISARIVGVDSRGGTNINL
jgi:acyl-CoA synthetase (AMP-forming)/AMP-acid ligase II